MVECLVLMWLAVIADGDSRTRRIPHALIWPGVVAVAAASPVHPIVGAAALVALLPYLVGAFAAGTGGGDVKLAAVTGGLVADPIVAMLMVCVAAVLDLAGRFGHDDARGARPHAPVLVAASIMALGVNG